MMQIKTSKLDVFFVRIPAVRNSHMVLLLNGYRQNEPLYSDVSALLKTYPVYTVHHDDNPDHPVSISAGISNSNRYGLLVCAAPLPYEFKFRNDFFNGLRSVNTVPFTSVGRFKKGQWMDMEEIMTFLVPEAEKQKKMKKVISRLGFPAYDRFHYIVHTCASQNNGKTFYQACEPLYFETKKEAEMYAQSPEMNSKWYYMQHRNEPAGYDYYCLEWDMAVDGDTVPLSTEKQYLSIEAAEKMADRLLAPFCCYIRVYGFDGSDDPSPFGEKQERHLVKVIHNGWALNVLVTDESQSDAEEKVRQALSGFPVFLCDCTVWDWNNGEYQFSIIVGITNSADKERSALAERLAGIGVIAED